MAIKTFNQVLEEVKGKPILVANRGIPARRICRSIRERFDAVPEHISILTESSDWPSSGASSRFIRAGDFLPKIRGFLPVVPRQDCCISALRQRP
jgi:hypothetical protein